MMTTPQAVHALSSVKEQQLHWANALGLAPDARCYLEHYGKNLFRPLSPATKASFEKGDGGELVPQPNRPAKMSALHSSSALAVNFFDYWTECSDRLPLQLALDAIAPISAIEFEVKYPTGLSGNAPNLDIVIRLQSGETSALESKFTEWLRPKPPNKEMFKPKYFPSGEGLWYQKGLQRCQELAEDLAGGREVFRYLDAPQLLKHALGLWSSSDRASLFYVYYDCLGSESEQHQNEIEKFTLRVGKEISFRSFSYQKLFARLWWSAGEAHADYLIYLWKRYFVSVEPSILFPEISPPVGKIIERCERNEAFELPSMQELTYLSRSSPKA